VIQGGEEDKEASKPAFLYTDTIRYDTIKLQRIFITSAIVASDFGDVLIVTSEARLYLKTRFVFRNEVGHCVPPYVLV